ncbi:hypothetical protein CRV01_04755 [Arcobacter sp. CECT 8983]|uniref:hypothetical protein n=1 Tax=Arcobacter sp. CECT 8983 TaxID=2044508 RepID=UPI00100A39AC|nr:hypothetical protein [Arcobacter sp. CECT 8983]RXJ90473.1 hypothetical protein CRV01_04755 [Arcobacter sp. CECT 8983]
MKSNMDDELSLDKIDDYNDKESKQKRNTVRLVVVFCLLVGAFFAYLKYNSVPDDYVGTKEAPGIDTSKK